MVTEQHQESVSNIGCEEEIYKKEFPSRAFPLEVAAKLGLTIVSGQYILSSMLQKRLDGVRKSPAMPWESPSSKGTLVGSASSY